MIGNDLPLEPLMTSWDLEPTVSAARTLEKVGPKLRVTKSLFKIYFQKNQWNVHDLSIVNHFIAHEDRVMDGSTFDEGSLIPRDDLISDLS